MFVIIIKLKLNPIASMYCEKNQLTPSGSEAEMLTTFVATEVNSSIVIVDELIIGGFGFRITEMLTVHVTREDGRWLSYVTIISYKIKVYWFSHN